MNEPLTKEDIKRALTITAKMIGAAEGNVKLLNHEHIVQIKVSSEGVAFEIFDGSFSDNTTTQFTPDELVEIMKGFV